MKIIIFGQAPIKTLKEIDVLADEVTAPDSQMAPFATTFFSTRTSQSERDILKILGFDLENIDSHSISQETLEGHAFDPELLEILEVSGEPTDMENLKVLVESEAKFTGFISYFE